MARFNFVTIALLSLNFIMLRLPYCETNGCSNFTFYKNLTGDVIVAGIFPVHTNQSTTGLFKYNKPGLIWIQSMLFAIDEINKNTELLPGVKLGYAIYDSCDMANFGLQAALDIMHEPEVLIGVTSSNKVSGCRCQKDKSRKPVLAVIGDASSRSTIRIASMLGAKYWSVPQISYSATSTDLSNKKYYPSFFRTIPPDNFQSRVIISLLKKFGWKYISLVASDDSYGRVGVEKLLPLLKENGMCFAVNEVFDVEGKKIDAIIDQLMTAENKNANVIILWCQRREAFTFLTRAAHKKLFGRTWIATETWGNTPDIYSVGKAVIQGIIGIIPRLIKYEPFEEYLNASSPNETVYNPWVKEYWETEYGCQLLTENNSLKKTRYRSYICNNTHELPTLNKLERNKYVNVMDSVYAVAHGLHLFLKSDGVFNVSRLADVSPQILLPFLKKVNFTGKANLPVQFDEKGDPFAAAYSITNLQPHKNGDLRFVTVGKWDSKDEIIVLESNLTFANLSSTPPISSCSEDCKPGFGRVKFERKPCCWNCVRCGEGQVQPSTGPNDCRNCSYGELPDMNKIKCVKPALRYLSFTSMKGIFLLVLMILSVLVCFGFTAVIIRFWSTPIVKGMNRELSLLQLISMLFIFAIPLLYLVPPTKFLCWLHPFYSVAMYTVSVSVTFTKTDRLLRIFKASRSGTLTRKSRVRNNRAQFLTVALLTFIGCIFTGILCIVLRPTLIEKVNRTYSTVEKTFSCGKSYKTLAIILLSYIFGIALTCTIFAFRARKLPENYNEARYTSFAMFSFCVVWLFFIPIYLSMKTSIDSDLVICVVSCVSTLAMLLIIYSKKTFVILFRPQENTAKEFRAKIRAPHSKDKGSTLSESPTASPSRSRATSRLYGSPQSVNRVHQNTLLP